MPKNGSDQSSRIPGGCCVTNWDEFVADNKAYRQRGLLSMEKIEEIHQWGTYLEAIDKNTSYLAKLDPISSAVRLFCWLVGGTIILTALAVGAKVILTPTSITTNMELYQNEKGTPVTKP